MKYGKTLGELATELERQAAAKRDFVADTRELTMLNGSELSITGQGEFTVARLAHEQLAARLDIPTRYYNRLKDAHPILLDSNVNTLLRANPRKNLVRTLDGNVRAYLSDRYRRLDNDDLANIILPVLAEIPDVEFPSVEITPSHLYITAVAPRITGEVKVGDVVQAGVRIKNSEVGLSSLSIEGLIYTLSCKNGMTAGGSVRRYHVGRQMEAEEAAFEIFKDETLRADDQAFWMKVRDMTAAAVNEARFQEIVSRLRDANETAPMMNPSAGVKELAKQFGFSEGESTSVLRHLVMGGNLTKYGALNAVTRAAQDVESYDRSMELESVGGAILDMEPASWVRVAVPA